MAEPGAQRCRLARTFGAAGGEKASECYGFVIRSGVHVGLKILIAPFAGKRGQTPAMRNFRRDQPSARCFGTLAVIGARPGTLSVEPDNPRAMQNAGGRRVPRQAAAPCRCARSCAQKGQEILA